MYLSERIDHFFFDPSVELEQSNRTLMRVRLGFEYGERGEIDLLQRIYLRLDLPETERRLHLLFFQRGEEPETLEQTSTIFPEQTDQVKFSLNSGLRYVVSDSPGKRLQFLIGTRIYPGLDPFSEIRGRLALPLGKWGFYPGQHLFWRDGIGFGETTLFDVDYPLARTVRLRLHADGTFSESSSGYDYNLSTSYAQEIRMRRGFRIELSMSGHTRPDNDVVHYLASFTWRQRIYRDWLYIEPAFKLLFPEDEDYSVAPSVIVLFEAVFGESQEIVWWKKL